MKVAKWHMSYNNADIKEPKYIWCIRQAVLDVINSTSIRDKFLKQLLFSKNNYKLLSQ